MHSIQSVLEYARLVSIGKALRTNYARTDLPPPQVDANKLELVFQHAMCMQIVDTGTIKLICADSWESSMGLRACLHKWGHAKNK